jgi:nitrite reductase/ring-hydroxylating ferredoxin subunit
VSQRLCAVAALKDGAAALVGDKSAPAQERILLVRRGARIDGYLNACPHMGLPLDFKPDRLVIGDGAFLRCSHHGAVFRIDDGVCVAGPCPGESLDGVSLRIVDGSVFLASEDGSSCRA